jgi:hypothetical protein
MKLPMTSPTAITIDLRSILPLLSLDEGIYRVGIYPDAFQHRSMIHGKLLERLTRLSRLEVARRQIPGRQFAGPYFVDLRAEDEKVPVIINDQI